MNSHDKIKYLYTKQGVSRSRLVLDNYDDFAPNFEMIGGAKCSLCKSEGTNMTTCPLNPKAVAEGRANLAKHPLAVPNTPISTIKPKVEETQPKPQLETTKAAIGNPIKSATQATRITITPQKLKYNLKNQLSKKISCVKI